MAYRVPARSFADGRSFRREGPGIVPLSEVQRRDAQEVVAVRAIGDVAAGEGERQQFPSGAPGGRVRGT